MQRVAIVDVHGLDEAEAFWRKAMDYEQVREKEGRWCVLLNPEGQGVPVSLQVRDDARAAQAVSQMRADPLTDDSLRFLSLGATRVEDRLYSPETTFVRLRDPNRNEFSVTEPLPAEIDLDVTTLP